MNKKKIEKMITHNIKSNGDFNKIKNRIIIKYKKKEKISFKEFIFSKRVLKYVCPLLALIISIPFIPKLFATNEMSSNQTNLAPSNETSNAESSQCVSNEGYLTENNSSSSSSVNQGVFHLSTIEVYGIIVINEDEKMFYTDETYGYYNELNQGKEFSYTGYYEINHLSNFDDLEINNLCYASIVVESSSSEFEKNDIFSVILLGE